MDVQGPGSVDRARPLHPSSVNPSSPIKSQPQGEPSNPVPPDMPADRVDLSPEARAAGAARRPEDKSAEGELRAQRLARIKAEIEAGTYDTPDKLEQALSLLFAEVGADDEDPA